MTRAVVVGSGPNGLAAAITLAERGVDVTVLEADDAVGGGTRSVEATLPGLVHDECSGFHPLAIDTGFTRQFDLSAHGLRFASAPVEYAHPLDGGGGAAAWRSVERTATELGRDAGTYRRLFGAIAERFDQIAPEFLRPMLHVPRSPLALARFGVYSAMPASWLASRFRDDEARALLAGVAAHAFRPLGAPFSSAIGVALGSAAHWHGWPVAVGGSRAISDAMVSLLHSLGGQIVTGVRVRSLGEIDTDIIMLDTSPSGAATIIGDRLPRRVARAYAKFRHGPGAYQVALAVEGGIPWTYEPTRTSGTVHLGGSFEEIDRAEKEIWAGAMPQRPFVLLGQQYLADPSRSVGDVHPVDAYAHVPAGFTGDATEAIIAQIERFAPGTRERIRHVTVRPTTAIAASNANLVGGDITTGANTPRQLVFRPRVTMNPYATGVPGVYLCSAATPPGAGAHGMCGWNAARSALTSAHIDVLEGTELR